MSAERYESGRGSDGNSGSCFVDPLVRRSPQIGDKWVRGMKGKVEIVDISATRVWLMHSGDGGPKYSSRKLEEWDEALAKTLAISNTTFIPANDPSHRIPAQ